MSNLMLFSDNTYGTLASGIAADATSITLTTGHGVRFPTVATGQVLLAIIVNSGNVMEQVHITAHTASSETLTVLRGQNGTTAKAWLAGDRIECRVTSESMEAATTFTQAGTSAVARQQQDKHLERLSVFDFMTVAQITDVLARTASVDVSDPVADAVTEALTSHKCLFFPSGTYLLNGGTSSASPDGYTNGILVPTVSGVSRADGLMIRGDGPGTILNTSSSNMIVLRACRSYVDIDDLTIDGGSNANTVIGCAFVPDDMTEASELFNTDYMRLGDGVLIVNCTDGFWSQPGPFGSGNYWHDIKAKFGEAAKRNLRAIYYAPAVDIGAQPTNRTTRLRITPTVHNGNTGVHLTNVDTFAIFAPWLDAVSDGTSPLNPACAIYCDDNTYNGDIFGGYAEDCTMQIRMPPQANNCRIHGYEFNGTINPASGSTYFLAQLFGGQRTVGAWTPTITSTPGGGTAGTNSSVGTFSIIGDRCYVNANVSVAKGTLTATDTIRMSLPFTARATTPASQCLNVTSWGDIIFTPAGATALACRFNAGVGTVPIYKIGTNIAGGSIITVQEFQGDIVFSIEGSYAI